MGVTGPPDQRFGAWARRLPAGERMCLDLDETFAESLRGTAATAVVTYLDRTTGRLLDVDIGNTKATVIGTGSGRWCQATFAIPAFAGKEVVLRAAGIPVDLHMVEIRHGTPRT